MTDTSPNDLRRRRLLLLIPLVLILAAASWIWWGDAAPPTEEEAALRARVGVPTKAAPSAECLALLSPLESSLRESSRHLAEVDYSDLLLEVEWSSLSSASLRKVKADHSELLKTLEKSPPDFFAGVTGGVDGAYELVYLLRIHTEDARREDDLLGWAWGMERLLDFRRHCVRSSTTLFQIFANRAWLHRVIMQHGGTSLAGLKPDYVIALSNLLVKDREEPLRFDAIWGSYLEFKGAVDSAVELSRELFGTDTPGWEAPFAIKRNRTLRLALRSCEECMATLEEERLDEIHPFPEESAPSQARWIPNRLGVWLYRLHWTYYNDAPLVARSRVAWQLWIVAVEIRRYEIERGDLPVDLGFLAEVGLNLDPSLYHYDRAERTIAVPALEDRYPPGQSDPFPRSFDF